MFKTMPRTSRTEPTNGRFFIFLISISPPDFPKRFPIPSSCTVGNQILSIGDQGRCRDFVAFLPLWGDKFVDEGLVDLVCVCLEWGRTTDISSPAYAGDDEDSCAENFIDRKFCILRHNSCDSADADHKTGS